MEAEVIMEDIIRVTGMFKIPQKWAKIHSICLLKKKSCVQVSFLLIFMEF